MECPLCSNKMKDILCANKEECAYCTFEVTKEELYLSKGYLPKIVFSWAKRRIAECLEMESIKELPESIINVLNRYEKFLEKYKKGRENEG